MEQRLSLVTLGVTDLARARAFYEALGWVTRAEPGDDVVFFQAVGMIVALWSREQLAEDSVVEDNGGWGGVTLAYNARSPADVDVVLDEARRAGARVAREGAETFWGGYSGECSSIPTAIPGRSRTTRTGRSRTTARSCSALKITAVRALPEDFDASALIAVLADGWGFDVEALDYAAVGGGSYHWLVSDPEGTRGFVTVDDLDQKPWLGETRQSVFDGLRRAFETAVALRDEGLGFVVAPIPARRGEKVRRIGRRYSVALFPFVDGQAGRYGHYEPAERAALVSMLSEVHQATPAVASVARRVGLDLPGRRRLEAALQKLDQTWSGGPFSEPARHALARNSSGVAALLALSDRLSAEVARRSASWVVTHGEPHGGNVMRTGERHVLVDWDTVALAPPERDLWMFVSEGADEATVYGDLTGQELDQAAVNFFRLAWELEDLAAFTNVLRAPHRHSADTVKAYEVLTTCDTIRDRWARLLE